MSNNSGEANFSFSIKNQMDQRQPLLTVRGDTALEFANNLTALGFDLSTILQSLGSTGTVAGASEQAQANIENAGLAQSVLPQAQQPATAVPQSPAQQPGVQEYGQQALTPPGAAPATPWDQQGGAPSAATFQAPVCAHGVRNHRTGTNARGEWRAWFCAAPKGTPNQCDPIWNRDPEYVAPQ